MPGFQVQQRTLITSKGRVAAPVRIAQPGAGWIFAVFIIKTPVDDEDFLTAMMRVFFERRVCCPTNQSDGFILKLMQFGENVLLGA